jgi:hypothetical protein
MCLCLLAQNWKPNQKHTVSVNPVTHTGSQSIFEGKVPFKQPITNNNLNTHHITISTTTKVDIYKYPIPLLQHKVGKYASSD